jgi:hypothetical protein
MSIHDIISTIDAELVSLQQARALIAGIGSSAPLGKKGGRPKKAKGGLSAAGRARIAEAQRRRWAEKKKGEG